MPLASPLKAPSRRLSAPPPKGATLESGELPPRASKQIEIAGVNFAAVVGRVMAFSLSKDSKGHIFF